MSRIIFASVVTLLASLSSAALHAAQPLVDGDWLLNNGDNGHVVVLDVRNAIDKGSKALYEKGHIPGAIYSNYLNDGWRTTRDDVVGMLPDIAHLERLIGGLGIGNDDHVVIVPAGVSAADYASATRVYWTFKVVGHDQVSILDGGYAQWTAQGRPLETGSNRRPPLTFTAQFRAQLIASRAHVEQVVNSGKGAMLIDNRPVSRFTGETKSGVAARFGAIPGARNIPQGRFFNKVDKKSPHLRNSTKIGARLALLATPSRSPIAIPDTGPRLAGSPQASYWAISARACTTVRSRTGRGKRGYP
ncbi:MAG: thiosulfate/3-mercaptopyruvate sulfurtransferase [Gammaproteobacteria bacterium]|jgi:thiosulfate/3-mercaptopyruvate sulfurtransferase